MPYIIYVPAIPRPYITNDPRIYMDCSKTFGWTCESRPYSDSYCEESRVDEDMRDEGDRRREQLERYWLEELDLRESFMKKVEIAHGEMPVDHDKHDSVHSVVVEVKEILIDAGDG
ncbi:uncharacterized protein K460DRAFT_281774 [Cucurbitaria berberidis CBS 394.84]|uniref:Uncharacterized protein n=1 Tax=Cucurbitaria berberidis CBS 394.84 TaxID=1168544 RepID=A0A9P4GK01_9PLEO|nr:uncharacterized protein K460DRAFT_281774 [Cucurbitaria berberidis CBS 394.84]KAF1846839.1 hypothetical protein K460DRAFT_281774 [Cucurbitaria berberidis CBS 394.84]